MATQEALRVGVIMGSDSDLKMMRNVGEALRDYDIEPITGQEERVISAHRTPEVMVEYAEKAAERGLDAIVAGAGGSAHLQGMTASHTSVPVIGVAVTSRPEVMNRALGSNIGMPEGKPLAVFQAADGAFNAGFFAGQIVSLREKKANRIGIVIRDDDERETMQHVTRALTTLGLQQGGDFEEHALGSDRDVSTYSRSLSTREIGVLVTASTDQHETPRLFANETWRVPILGVAITDNPDVMSSALDSLVNTHRREAIGAFQGNPGAFNAGLFAARILGITRPEVRAMGVAYEESLRTSVYGKDRVLKRLGADRYLALDPAERDRLIAEAAQL